MHHPFARYMEMNEYVYAVLRAIRYGEKGLTVCFTARMTAG